MSGINLCATEDLATVKGVLESISDDAQTSVDVIKQLLAESDFAQYKWVDAGINQLVSAYEKAKDDPDFELPVSFVIATRKDASFQLSVSPDKLSATAIIKAAYGGEPIKPAQIKNALKEASIRKGVNQRSLAALLKKSYQIKPGAVIKSEFASGQPAVHGVDGQWVSDTQTLFQQLNAPREREDGTVDHLDFGEILTVKEGELLMHLEPPTPGETGYTVTGEYLEPIPGKEVPFSPADGVTLSEDKTQILAARQGIPVEIPRGIRVDKIFTANKVDLSSGHIVFDGSVIVKENVEESMKITATGDVTIGGSVHFAQIEAGGDIIVRKGIFGRQHDDDSQIVSSEALKCILQADGRIQANFAQYARLEAGGSISIDRQLLHCHTTTPGTISLGSDKDRNSKLIGGMTRAGQEIHCANYGTEAFIPTHIELLPDISDFESEEHHISTLLKTKLQLLKELEPIVPKLETIADKPGVQAKMGKLVNTIQHTRAQASELQEKIKSSRHEKDQLLQATKLIARGNIFPNVKVHIAGQTLKISHECQGGGISYQNGEILYNAQLK